MSLSTPSGASRSRHTRPPTARSARKASPRRIPAPLLLLRSSRDEGPLPPRADRGLARVLWRYLSGAQEARRRADLAREGRGRRAVRLPPTHLRPAPRGLLESRIRRDLQPPGGRRWLGREYPRGGATG